MVAASPPLLVSFLAVTWCSHGTFMPWDLSFHGVTSVPGTGPGLELGAQAPPLTLPRGLCLSPDGSGEDLTSGTQGCEGLWALLHLSASTGQPRWRDLAGHCHSVPVEWVGVLTTLPLRGLWVLDVELEIGQSLAGSLAAVVVISGNTMS